MSIFDKLSGFKGQTFGRTLIDEAISSSETYFKGSYNIFDCHFSLFGD